MIESGRRMGMVASQVRCAKVPGAACAAHWGAASRITNCRASQASWVMTRASSRKIVPRFSRLTDFRRAR
jgi:hypothetical protein